MGKKPRPPGHVTAEEVSGLVLTPVSRLNDMAREGLLPAKVEGQFWRLDVIIPAVIRAKEKASERATAADAANHLGIRERGFRELVDKGVIERQPRGAYNLETVRLAFIAHLREQAAGRGADGDQQLAKNRAWLAREQAEAQARKNAADRGELLPRDEIHLAVTEIFGRFRQKMLGVPKKLAPIVFGAATIGAVQDKLSVAINEALAELSTTVLISALGRKPAGARRRAGLAADRSAAADVDSQPMG